MIRPGRGATGQPGRVLAGVVLVARGRAAGLARFDATPQGFLASLAPLVAFPLAGELLVLLAGGGLPGLADLLEAICGLLAPPVLTQALAQRWGREAGWLRYATAFNWCQWAVPLVALALVVAVSVPAALLGLSGTAAAGTAVALVLAYGLWLHWFLARHGLGLDGLRAAALVVLVNFGTLLVLAAPRLVAMAVGPQPGPGLGLGLGSGPG